MPTPKERLSHLLELAAQGAGERAALAGEVADLLLDWPETYPAGMRATFEALLEKIVREIDLVRVKGRAGAAPVYELVGRAGHPIDPTFAEALTAYRSRKFTQAHAAFAALTADPAAAVMARRCEVLAAEPPPDDWDGVYEQRAK